jgi:hypothetical protein
MGRILAGLLIIACAGCASGATAVSGKQSGAGGVTAVWRPDINSASQRTVTTHGTAAQAHDLVGDLAALPPSPKGTFACPASLGIAVRLTVTSGTSVAHANVLLTGCPEVVIGGASRQITKTLANDLRPLAPPRWQRYLRDY